MSDTRLARVQSLVRDVPNFPKEGILFKDVTPVLADGAAFQATTELLSESLPGQLTKLVAIESRGFIFGSAIAHHLGIGLVLVRKPGKLPREVHSIDYELEYGMDQLQVHKDDLSASDRVVIIDDVLATGGTARAVEELCGLSGSEVLGHRFVIELGFLKGARRLRAPVQSLMTF